MDSYFDYWRFRKSRMTRARFLGGMGVTTLGAAALSCSTGPKGGGSSGGGGSPVAGVPKPGSYIDDLKPRPFLSTEAAKPGGVLNLHYTSQAGGLNSEPMNMDPVASADVNLGWLAGFVGNGLLKWTETKEYGQLENTPDLAKSWETPDETTIVFHLQDGVRWHDVPPVNGRDLTADDVKFTLMRQKTGAPAKFQINFMYDAIDTIETPDKNTAVLKLRTRDIALITKLGHPQYIINCHEVVDKYDDTPPTLVGTGPFIMTRYTKGGSFELKKNPTYWKKGLPYLDGVNVLIVGDPAAKLANLRAKKVDVEDVPYSQLQPFRRSNPDAVAIKVPGNVQGGFGINQKAPPFTDIRVRQAVQLATDIRDFINIAWDGQGQQNPGCWWYQHPYVIPQEQAFKYNPDKAKALLAQAGVTNLRFTATANGPGRGPGSSAQLFEIWQEQLKKIGVQIDIEAPDSAKATQQIYLDRAFQVYSYALAATHEDPDRFWMVFVYPKAGRQPVNYQDPRMTQYLEAQRIAKTIEERAQWYQKAQFLNVEDPGYIFLVTPYKFVAMQPYVRNWVPRASFGSVTRNSDEMWLEKS